MRLWLVPFRESPDKWVLVAAKHTDDVLLQVDGIYGEPGRKEDWIELRSTASIDLTAREEQMEDEETSVFFEHADDDFGFHFDGDREVLKEVARKRLAEFDPDEPRIRYVWLAGGREGEPALYMFADEDPFRDDGEVIATVIQRRPFHQRVILDAVRSTLPFLDGSEALQSSSFSSDWDTGEKISLEEDLSGYWS